MVYPFPSLVPACPGSAGEKDIREHERAAKESARASSTA